jgi:hypothetical protein
LDSFYLSTTAQTWDGNEEDRIVCRFPTGTGQFSDMGRENLANARLIASAPDLLLALETLLSDRSCPSFLTLEEWRNTHPEFRETLRKAKGEA